MAKVSFNNKEQLFFSSVKKSVALDASEYRAIKAKLQPEIERLIRKQTELNSTDENVDEILAYGFHFLRNLPKLFSVATLEEKSMIIGSPFPEKLIFLDGEVRTACPNVPSPYLSSRTRISEEIKKGVQKFLHSLPVKWR